MKPKGTFYDPKTNRRTRPTKLKIGAWGLQAKIARMTGISAPAVNFIFTGARRATPDVAAKMEKAFAYYGIHINRLDLLYEVKDGQSLFEFLKEREED